MRTFGVIVVLILMGLFLWMVTSSSFAVQAELVSVDGTIQPRFRRQVRIEDPQQPLQDNNTSSQGMQPLVIPPQDLPIDDLVSSVKVPPAKKNTEIQEIDQPVYEFERLVIPTLKVDSQLTPRPYSELSWDLSDLGHSIALLGDIPDRETLNNTILAGHVTVRNGSNGPFRYLSRLNPGDKIILYTERFKHTFIVREQVLVYPDDTTVIQDTPHPQLTLITCTTWDEKTMSYLRRRVVFADLEKVDQIVSLAD